MGLQLASKPKAAPQARATSGPLARRGSQRARPSVGEVLRSSRGQPLDSGTRAYFEPRFGHDFSKVRVHRGPLADESARGLHATAYTVGHDVVFRDRAFAPASAPGRRLLAHELTHVVQQTDGGPRRVARQLDSEPDATGRDTPAPDLESAPPEVTHVVRQIRGRAPGKEAPDGKGGKRESGSPQRQDERPVPGATVTCVKKWQYCRAPYSPGTWAARTTYHCPVFVPPIILPGTTRPAFLTIPDEFVGTSPTGRDRYRCRPRSSVVKKTTIADAAATLVNRMVLYPDFASCHAGYRTLLHAALEVVFRPSGGGRPAGTRVNQTAPGGGGRPFPCP